MTLAKIIEWHSQTRKPIFNPALTRDNTIPIDLSASNPEFNDLESVKWDQAISDKIDRAGATAAVGGYLEKRSVYENTETFQGQQDRNVHIGIDVFMPASTAIHAPLDGIIHCYANRQAVGDSLNRLLAGELPIGIIVNNAGVARDRPFPAMEPVDGSDFEPRKAN